MSKRYINVAYHDKALAKRHGALWDETNRRWYYAPTSQLDVIFAWRAAATVEPTNGFRHRIYINVPDRETVLARSLGAEWDSRAGSFYVPGGTDLAKIYSWRKPGLSQSKPVLPKRAARRMKPSRRWARVA